MPNSTILLAASLLIVGTYFIYLWQKKPKSITGTITEVECSSTHFGNRPVKIFTFVSDKGRIFRFGVAGCDERFSKGIRLEVWPSRETIANEDRIREITNKDGTITIKHATTYWYKMRKFRIHEE